MFWQFLGIPHRDPAAPGAPAPGGATPFEPFEDVLGCFLLVLFFGQFLGIPQGSFFSQGGSEEDRGSAVEKDRHRKAGKRPRPPVPDGQIST